MTDLRIKCQACHKNPATKENFERFNGGFWCDDCVKMAKRELVGKV